MDETNSADDRLSRDASLTKRVDQLCDQFEAALNADQSPQIAEYLVQVPDSDRPSLLEQLLLVELEVRSSKGESIKAQHYCEQLPDYADLINAVISDHHRSTSVAETTDWSAGDTGPPGKATPATNVAREGTTFGRFELIERVGQGSFGTVYRARDPNLDREVAIKIPRRGQLDAEESDNFLREARAAGQLKHANIVRVYDTGDQDGQVYIVSDFIQGETLAERLSATPYTPHQAAKLCSQVADALDHAHEAGVIHRDLKPSNIMLDDKGHPHVMDFGLAKRESGEMTRTVEGQLLGTPAYMSPEQAKGSAHAADRRSDVYSLGVILFELLTGARPFRGKRQMLLHQVLNEDAPNPRKLSRNVPRDLETICLKCLSKEPSKRYPTAVELADELNRWLENKPILARPVSRVERAWRWARRHPARAALMTVSAGALLAVASLGVGYRYQKSLKTANAYLKTTQRSLVKANVNLESSLEREKETSRELETAKTEIATARERITYLRNVANAFARWKDSDVPGAERILHQCPSEQRHWEWYYVYRLCNSELLSFSQHSARAVSVAFSPIGNRIASASEDRTIKVWDAEDGRELFTFPGRRQRSFTSGNSVAFNANGSRIIGGSTNNTVKVWDANTGKELLTLKGHTANVNGVSYSPNGKLICAGGEFHDASLRGGELTVWDAVSGRRMFTHREQQPFPNDHFITSVAFSPDSKQIAAGIRNFPNGFGELKIWDVESGQETFVSERRAWVNSVAFSPDGKRVAAAGGINLQLLDLRSGEQAVSFKGHSNDITSVAYSPDGKQIASGSMDRTIKVWNAETGDEVRTFRGYTSYVSCVAFSPDGKRIIGSGGNWDTPGEVRVWNAESDQEANTWRVRRGQSWILASSPAGRQLAFPSDNTVEVWDAQSSTKVCTFEGHRNEVSAAAFSPDGKHLASSDGQTLKVWDTESGKEICTLDGDNENVGAVTFSPDGKHLASADGKTVKVWDTGSGKEICVLEGPSKNVGAVTFGPDGKHLASADGNIVKVCDAESGKQICTLEGHSTDIRTMAFSPDGKHFASADRQTVKVWDMETKKATFALSGHMSSPIESVAFSPDSLRLVSADFQGIKIWDLKTGLEALKLKKRVSFPNRVYFSQDGAQVISVGRAGNVNVWTAAGNWNGNPPALSRAASAERKRPETSEESLTLANAMRRLGAKATFQGKHVVGVSFYMAAGNADDATLALLKGASELKELHLDDSPITDEGLKHLSTLTNLRLLSIHSPDVTDRGVAHLKNLTKLENLSLYGSQLTDQGLRHLKGMTNLKSLNLYGTKVSDAGLVHLKGLSKLKDLYLFGAAVTPLGAQGLKQSLPGLHVVGVAPAPKHQQEQGAEF